MMTVPRFQINTLKTNQAVNFGMSNPLAAHKSPEEMSIDNYYREVDARDFTKVLGRFGPYAVYERDGWEPIRGFAKIKLFFEVERTLKGAHTVHKLETIQTAPSEFGPVPEGKKIYVEGSFEGENQGKPVKLTFKDLWVFHPQGQIVIFRKSLIAFSPETKVDRV